VAAAIRTSGLFDGDWYRNTYPDVQTLDMDPVEHFVSIGARLGRNPSKKFDTKLYLATHPELPGHNVNPLLHFIESRRDRAPATTLSSTILPLSVSTIILSYNHEFYIERAIESAISQHGIERHQIIVSDDGSSDTTREIIDGYAARFPELIINISSPSNSGISNNFRRCFSASSGTYIAVLEGDDYWVSDDKLLWQSRFLQSNDDCSMVFSKIALLDQSSGEFKYLDRQGAQLSSKLNGRDFLADPNMNLIVNFSSCMFRASLVKNLPDVLYAGRLSEIALAFYLENFGKIGFIQEVMGVYRQHSAGVWTGSDRRAQLESALNIRRAAKQVAREEYKEKIQRVIDEQLLPALSNL